MGTTTLLISLPSSDEDSNTSKVPCGVGTLERDNSTWKLPRAPPPEPAVMKVEASSVPSAARTRAWKVASKPVPMPHTPTGSSTMSKGWGWPTLMGGRPAAMTGTPGQRQRRVPAASPQATRRPSRSGQFNTDGQSETMSATRA